MILYAVIAPKGDEVEEVLVELRKTGLTHVIDWFKRNKAELYGPRSDDWKPFELKTLDQLLNVGGKNFKSQTKLIAALDQDFTNINTVLEAGIVIYFIDVFALFLQRYKDLAIRLDGALANSEKCCFVSTFGLSDDFRGLMATSRKSWPAVFDNYMEGKLHRIALGPDDVVNLRNYWISRIPKELNPALEQQLSQLLGRDHPTDVPRNQPQQPR